MIELVTVERPALDWVAYCAMPPADQLVWEERGDDLTKSMLFTMNLKNDNTKKDLCLAYSQGNKIAYVPTIEAMARYLSTQYSNNKPANQGGGKKGDKKKGDESRSEDKDGNTGGTAGAHVEDTTTTEESTVPNKAPSIGTHVSKINVQSSNSLRTVEEILGAHPMNDDDF